MEYIRLVYLLVTGLFLCVIAADSSILTSLGIIRFLPYLFIATFVILSSRYKLSVIQKGLFIIFIFLIGSFTFLIGSLSELGCLGGGHTCTKEFYDHLKVSGLFFIISAVTIAFLPQQMSKNSKRK